MQMNRVRLFAGQRILFMVLPWCFGIGTAFIFGVVFIPLPYGVMVKMHIIGTVIVVIFSFFIAVFFWGKHSKSQQKKILQEEIESYKNLIAFLNATLAISYITTYCGGEVHLKKLDSFMSSKKEKKYVSQHIISYNVEIQDLENLLLQVAKK